jgi:hypothetical protein
MCWGLSSCTPKSYYLVLAVKRLFSGQRFNFLDHPGVPNTPGQPGETLLKAAPNELSTKSSLHPSPHQHSSALQAKRKRVLG